MSRPDAMATVVRRLVPTDGSARRVRPLVGAVMAPPSAERAPPGAIGQDEMMRALVQRVTEARVRVDGQVVGEIGPGLCVLLGVSRDDTEAEALKVADKLWGLRLLADADGVMNLSVAETAGAILVVSQFTLYGDTRKGRRPSWIQAAPPEQAEPLVTAVVDRLGDLGATVATGRFRADMQVALVNDGPATVLIEV